MTVRLATQADCAAIAEIWNPVIRETTITFNPVEKSPEDIAAYLREKEESGGATFVAEGEGGQVMGFATYGQFRGGLGYRFTAEHSIVLGEGARGLGIGRQLMAAIEDHARARGIHTIFAGVCTENAAGVAFHKAMGFESRAVLPQVGFKFGRWLDLDLMQKRLGPPDSGAKAG